MVFALPAARVLARSSLRRTIPAAAPRILAPTNFQKRFQSSGVKQYTVREALNEALGNFPLLWYRL